MHLPKIRIFIVIGPPQHCLQSASSTTDNTHHLQEWTHLHYTCYQYTSLKELHREMHHFILLLALKVWYFWLHLAIYM